MASPLEVEIESLKTQLSGFMSSIEGRLRDIDADLSTLENNHQVALNSVLDEVTVLRRLVCSGASTSIQNEGRPNKIKIPEPKPFIGVRNAKELENFIWDVEQYFRAAHIPDGEKVNITSMYMSGDAKLWWRTRLEDKFRPEIRTWEELRQEMKDQFLPCNSAWVARESLKRLRQGTGTIREYVKQFSSIMLDIRNMSEEDKVFNFIKGLNSYGQGELVKAQPKDLAAAMTFADSLMDLNLGGRSSSENVES